MIEITSHFMKENEEVTKKGTFEYIEDAKDKFPGYGALKIITAAQRTEAKIDSIKFYPDKAEITILSKEYHNPDYSGGLSFTTIINDNGVRFNSRDSRDYSEFVSSIIGERFYALKDYFKYTLYEYHLLPVGLNIRELKTKELSNFMLPDHKARHLLEKPISFYKHELVERWDDVHNYLYDEMEARERLAKKISRGDYNYDKGGNKWKSI